MRERAEVLLCDNSELVSIVHEPAIPGDTGLVIIVAGGPQYRVGAHRQFVMLARQIAAAGLPVIRFDHRGTGDSDGDYRGFTDMDADIRSAIDHLFSTFPSLSKVVLWGECESASAAAYYAHKDARVSGIFLVNPWIRTEAGLAKTYLKHYYRQRITDPEFWKKVRAGEFSISASIKSIATLFYQVISNAGKKEATREPDLASLPLPERLERSLLLFQGEIFVLTSGRDHIAQEYRDFVDGSAKLQSLMALERAKFKEIAEADHTFSRTAWRVDLFDTTQKWLESN
ncbi:MAG: hydrolase 1, exosortase A system-associated [Pseudomonadales bacterium]|nr:hydrolase 1, exosortase A system-associated [Halioglobus sp.]MCP5129852.1 hydrolase 1, exosortase A system-associated [Pseudomonadales bacterium]